MGEEEVTRKMRFGIGMVVHHLHYDYRGVIMGADATCQADEAWYQKNRSQPDRDQPWYHVLVDGADHTTYVAQENLEQDPTGAPVVHPLLNRIFGTFLGGRYHREHLN